MIAPLLELLDAGLVRLFVSLFVDYLISTGFLLPQQRQQWVEGWAQIVGGAGALVFIAIWQYHSHKKETLKVITQLPNQTTETTIENPTKIEDTTDAKVLHDSVLEKYKM